MKKFISDFVNRGLTACGFGPIVLAIIYLILQNTAGVDTLTVNEMCKGIFSITALAFVAGGINAIHQIERLPLMSAILIHGAVLYLCYLGTYLFNSWLKLKVASVLIFTVAFVVGYFVIWVIVCITMKKKTENINKILKQKQQTAENE